ncbi:recombination protein NinB [Cupriavidus respiraculi]|uniref:Recombinase n=1 Tax=Cupriavidus respiraculi TaxID=195930 RepID=A0ABN7YL52_9BURK|nr:recombination protein NinB [Cupriavidus respiraculi]CAG9173146.1 hypothetical protein LMG21510_02167 [Cupriavidus respiraculi]
MALYREFPLTGPRVWPTVVAFVKANAAACIEKGRPLRIIVTAEERRRTAEQNAFYFGPVLRDIEEQAWVDGQQFKRATWHEYYADLFAPKAEFRLPDGRLCTRRKSTSEFTVGEFSEYVAKVQAHAANEFGVSFDGVHA